MRFKFFQVVIFQMEQQQKPTLGYWNIRGLGAQCTYLLAYCEVDYNLREYKGRIVDGKPDADGWFEDKKNLGINFPNLPYFIDGDIKMAETLPLMRYICRKYKPEILGKSA